MAIFVNMAAMPPGVGNCPLVLTVSVLSAPPLGHGRVFDVRRGQGRIEEAQIYIRGRWQNGGGGVRVVEGVRVGRSRRHGVQRAHSGKGRGGLPVGGGGKGGERGRIVHAAGSRANRHTGGDIVIASSDTLCDIVQSPSDNNDGGDIATRTYKRCVQPGAYTFAISDSAGDELGNDGQSGYYVEANGVMLGVSSFFYNEERMSFSLPFDANEDRHHHNDGDDDDSICTDDFVLAIRTDQNPGETTWDVVDDRTGRTVLRGGPYATPDAM